MSFYIQDGVPYINDKPGILDPMSDDDFMIDALSDYRCPECSARLAKESMNCMNACSLSAESLGRINSLLEQCSRGGHK